MHFTGHGVVQDQETALVLEDELGIAYPMTADELRSRLGPLREAPCHLAVLSACHSQGMAQVLLDKGVPHVVAVRAKDTILDTVARCFAEHFYPPLLNDYSVSEAHDQALAEVRWDKEFGRLVDPATHEPLIFDERDKIRLLPEGSVSHDEKLPWEGTKKLDPAAPAKIIVPSWDDHTNLLPSSADNFVGRRMDLHKIARIVRAPKRDGQAPRCLLLNGMGGMGKTALAKAAGRWHHERARFSEGGGVGLRPSKRW